jgi:hypothetical protein
LLAFKGFLHLAPLHQEIFDHTLAFGKSDSYRPCEWCAVPI